jgi:hypothetical protein
MAIYFSFTSNYTNFLTSNFGVSDDEASNFYFYILYLIKLFHDLKLGNIFALPYIVSVITAPITGIYFYLIKIKFKIK